MLVESLLALHVVTAAAGADTGREISAPIKLEQDRSTTIELFVGRSRHVTPPWPVAGVSLTDPEVADVQVVTPNLVLVSGKGPGTTDLLMWSEDGTTTEIKIEVHVDLSRLTTELAAALPGANLSVEQSGRLIVVKGPLQTGDQSLQLRAILDGLEVEYVDLSTVPGIQQVQVKVRVAEVSRQKIRSLGINGFYNGDDFIFGSTVGSEGGGPINPISIGPPGGAAAGGDTPFVFHENVAVSPAVTMFAGVPSWDLELFFQALAENQYLRLLAEPNLVAMNGEEASFLAGGEFPIPVVQGGGSAVGTSITIEYKEFGVALKFTPTVLGEGRIQMRLASEVSDLTDIGAVDIQGFRIPAIVARKTETSIEMRSGQTFAMSGLINERTNAMTSRIPGLGSLPVLGPLFRSVRYSSGETELVVLVTASLVEPLSQTSFPPLPGEEHIVPSDWELLAEGSIEGRAPAKVPFSTAKWLQEQGLSRLKGPGAWASHGTDPSRSRAKPGARPPGADSQGPSPEADPH